ncbi:MAG: VOC family protein [Myxococcales bacterium]|nr:VOC family protein [Myxococcales bacterium]
MTQPDSPRPQPDSPRPFRVLGIQQIAVGGLDKASLRGLWVDLLGLCPSGTFRSERENVDEDIVVVGAGPMAVEVDLMQPIDPEKKPRVHEPALNHIGLWIDDLPAAVAWLQGRGVRFTPGGIRKGAGGHDVCFIHPRGDATSPRSGEGVLIELVQAPPEVVRFFDSVAGAQSVQGGFA